MISNLKFKYIYFFYAFIFIQCAIEFNVAYATKIIKREKFMFMWILGKFKIFHSWMRPNCANTNKKILSIPKWNWDTSRRNVFITMGIEFKYIVWNINSNSSFSVDIMKKSSLNLSITRLYWVVWNNSSFVLDMRENISFLLSFDIEVCVVEL